MANNYYYDIKIHKTMSLQDPKKFAYVNGFHNIFQTTVDENGNERYNITEMPSPEYLISKNTNITVLADNVDNGKYVEYHRITAGEHFKMHHGRLVSICSKNTGGEVGPTGPTGPKGPKGDTGKQGVAGIYSDIRPIKNWEINDTANISVNNNSYMSPENNDIPFVTCYPYYETKKDEDGNLIPLDVTDKKQIKVVYTKNLNDENICLDEKYNEISFGNNVVFVKGCTFELGFDILSDQFQGNPDNMFKWFEEISGNEIYRNIITNLNGFSLYDSALSVALNANTNPQSVCYRIPDSFYFSPSDYSYGSEDLDEGIVLDNVPEVDIPVWNETSTQYDFVNFQIETLFNKCKSFSINTLANFKSYLETGDSKLFEDDNVLSEFNYIMKRNPNNADIKFRMDGTIDKIFLRDGVLNTKQTTTDYNLIMLWVGVYDSETGKINIERYLSCDKEAINQ